MGEWAQVNRARRVLASEQGAIIRDWGGRLPIVLAYPNSYSVGMSSLAIHGLYRALNALPGVVCERAFAALDRRGAATEPLITLESQRPVGDAAVVAFSVSFEMDYFNIVQMLRRARVPVRADERDASDPLVILGGPAVAANPEPMALVADAIVIGEAEPVLADLVDVARDLWAHDRATTLTNLARLAGVYVPLLGTEQPVQRLFAEDLDACPTRSAIIAPGSEFGDLYLIEIARGCGRGCRFCLAGYWYRPRRERSLERILSDAREGLAFRAKVGLVASSVSDYTRVDDLVLGLRRLGADISVSSLRVKPLSSVLVRALSDSGARSITLAPEAGSERLRRAIRKGVTHDDIIAATEMVGASDFETLKLYFMIGLPGESEDDIDDLVRLVTEVKAAFPRKVTVNVAPFVPKAHTPFERVAMAEEELLGDRLARIRAEMGRIHVQFRGEAAASARVQGVLARGDRRVGGALIEMARPTPGRFARALRDSGLSMPGYLGEIESGRPLPWGMVQSDPVGPRNCEESA